MNPRNTATGFGLRMALVLASLVVLGVGPLAGQTGGKAGAQVTVHATSKIPLNEIQQDLAVLQTRHTGLSKADQRRVRKYSATSARALTTLHAEVVKPDRVSAVFVSDLDASQQALRDIAAKKVLTAHDIKRLALISRDIELKEQHVLRFMSGPAPGVEVAVSTQRGGNEVKGLQVIYLVVADENRSHGVAFPKFSSPTTKTLSPGVYTFWCRDTNVAPPIDGTESEFEVSWNDGNLAFDVPAPAAPPVAPEPPQS